MTILRAAWLASMTGPPIENGAVAFEAGKIVAAGRWADIRGGVDGRDTIDLGDSVILPGLINAHTHLELSLCTPGEMPASFVDWVFALTQQTRRGEASTKTFFEDGVRAGIAESLRFGVTTVGDISQRFEASRNILRDSPLRAVSFGEMLGLAKLKPRFDDLFSRVASDTAPSERLIPGISPHAPYTVDLDGYRRCVSVARERNMPIATHLAETPDEGEFLVSQSGEFRRLWEAFGQWSDGVETFHGSPIEFADAVGLLDLPAVLAHVNYCTDDELKRLSRSVASIVYCPRTHRYFGHPPHRWREMLAAGINVAVGTDSRASSPDLNLVDEVRLLHTLAPDVPAIQLWELITSRAAKALQLERSVGVLVPGHFTDIAAFPVGKTRDPLQSVLQSDAQPSHVWTSGNKCETGNTSD